MYIPVCMLMSVQIAVCMYLGMHWFLLHELTTCQQSKKECLGVAVEALDNEPNAELWDRYFDDFAHHKVHVASKAHELTNVLKIFFGGRSDEKALSQIIALHVRLHVHHVDVTKIAGILKPIFRMQQQVDQTLSSHEPSSTFPTTLLSFAPPVYSSVSILTMAPNLAAFVVETLFHYICYLNVYMPADMDSLTQWYRCYHNVVSL